MRIDARMLRSLLILAAVAAPSRLQAQAPATASDSASLAFAVAVWLGAQTPGGSRGPYVLRGDGRAHDGAVWAERIAATVHLRDSTLIAAAPTRETLRVMFGPVVFSGDTATFRIGFNRCRLEERITYSGNTGSYGFRRERDTWVYIRPERMVVAVGDGLRCPW